MLHGDGSRLHPWRTLTRACKSVPGRPGRHDPHQSRDLYGVRLLQHYLARPISVAAGRQKDDATRVVPIPSCESRNCSRRGNVQSISGLHLDGQNKSAGTLGMSVQNVRGLTIRDM